LQNATLNFLLTYSFVIPFFCNPSQSAPQRGLTVTFLKYSVKSYYVIHFALPGYMTKCHRGLKWSKYAVRTSAEAYPNGFEQTCKRLFMRHWGLVMCTGNSGVLVQSALLHRHKREIGETKQGKTARNTRIYVDCTTM